MHPRAPSPRSWAPPATAGIPNRSQATSSAWPPYQGNFSISLLSPQIGPLADADKGLFMGNVVHHLLLHCIFYACVPQSIFTDKCHCLSLQMAPRGKHGKLSGSTKVAQKARAEVGTELRARAPRPSCRQVSLCEPLPTLPQRDPLALLLQLQSRDIFLASAAQTFGWRGHLAKSMEADGLAKAQRGGMEARGPLRRGCRRQAQRAITLPVWLRFYCQLGLKVSKVVINEKEI